MTNDGFGMTFDHARVSTLSRVARLFGFVQFSVDENVRYSATGAYAANDPDGKDIYLEASLVDLTMAAEVVFKSSHQSLLTPNESFVLGAGLGGDQGTPGMGPLTGWLTGMLIAGHNYRFNYNAFIATFESASTMPATASGFLSLNFSAVPEPGTAILLSGGLVGFAAIRRRSLQA